MLRKGEDVQEAATIGERIKKARGKRSVRKLAQKAEVPESNWRAYEKDVHDPPFATGVAIADVLGVDPYWLVTGKKKTPRPTIDRAGTLEGRLIAPIGSGLIQSGEVPDHAVVKFIGLSVNGELQVALDLVIHGQPDRADVAVDVSDLKLKRDS